MKNSHIQWTDHTFNPWIGCTKVSPGCAHCYAESLNKRWRKGANWGPGAPRQRTSESNWKQPLKWNATSVCDECGKLNDSRNSNCGYPDPVNGFCDGTLRRPRVFCASLADWLDDEVPIEWFADLLKLIHDTPNLDWQLLTKRPQNWRPRIEAALLELHDDSGDDQQEHGWIDNWLCYDKVPENIWIGTTGEDQTRFYERVEAYLDIPARVHFLSCEPLLSPLNISFRCLEVAADWVIVGAESGPNRRPMKIEWARDLLSQCRNAGIAPFMKQIEVDGAITGDFDKFPGSVQVREFPTL